MNIIESVSFQFAEENAYCDKCGTKVKEICDKCGSKEKHKIITPQTITYSSEYLAYLNTKLTPNK